MARLRAARSSRTAGSGAGAASCTITRVRPSRSARASTASGRGAAACAATAVKKTPSAPRIRSRRMAPARAKAPSLRHDTFLAKRGDALPRTELAQDLVGVLAERGRWPRGIERAASEARGRPGLADAPAERMLALHEGAVLDDLRVRVQLVQLAHDAARHVLGGEAGERF